LGYGQCSIRVVEFVIGTALAASSGKGGDWGLECLRAGGAKKKSRIG